VSWCNVRSTTNKIIVSSNQMQVTQMKFRVKEQQNNDRLCEK
jgi:hypothetical protein